MDVKFTTPYYSTFNDRDQMALIDKQFSDLGACMETGQDDLPVQNARGQWTVQNVSEKTKPLVETIIRNHIEFTVVPE